MQEDINSKGTLHLVCFNNPYPPDYGGVIDVFFKVKALHESGVRLILHCFVYGRRPMPELARWCETVYYYKRPLWPHYLLHSLPFIVVSRQNPTLLRNLLADDAPVLLEGLHCTAFLDTLINHGKRVAVRCHNVEHDYYRHLAQATRHPFKRLYYYLESRKLKRFEPILKKATYLFSLSVNDQKWFSSQYGSAELLPVFHSSYDVTCLPGRGQYLLMHGNLSVRENEMSIEYLLAQVLKDSDYPIVIAGKNPTAHLRRVVARYPNAMLFSNPDEAKMLKIQQDAHVILLHSHQPTGIKLKLLSSLANGRFVVANGHVLNGSGVEALCDSAETVEQWKDLIKKRWEMDFPLQCIDERRAVLMRNFDNLAHANRLIQVLMNDAPLNECC